MTHCYMTITNLHPYANRKVLHCDSHWASFDTLMIRTNRTSRQSRSTDWAPKICGVSLSKTSLFMDIGLKHCLVFCHVGNPWGNRETKKNDQHQHALNALGETGGTREFCKFQGWTEGKIHKTWQVSMFVQIPSLNAAGGQRHLRKDVCPSSCCQKHIKIIPDSLTNPDECHEVGWEKAKRIKN